MHKGRVHDVTQCYNLGKKCVPPSNYDIGSIFPQVITMGDFVDSTLMHINGLP